MTTERDLRRVLMLTAYWPPVSRAGTRRPLRLARRLHRFGWEPVILTPEALPFFEPPLSDPSLSEPPVEVHRVRARFVAITTLRSTRAAAIKGAASPQS